MKKCTFQSILIWMFIASSGPLLVLTGYAMLKWDIDPIRYFLDEERPETLFAPFPRSPTIVVEPVGETQRQSWLELEGNKNLHKPPMPLMIPTQWESEYEDTDMLLHFPHEEMGRALPLSSSPSVGEER